MASSYHRSGSLPGHLKSTPPLHNVESVFPLDFYLDWDETPQANSTSGRAVLSPLHHKTALLGLIPIPNFLSSLKLTIHVHEDGKGWDLDAAVSSLTVKV